jgi:hypothetical protein
MKGDFTRDTFDHTKHFSRVLMQQGRVTLDADHNEQTAILLHYVRMLARDVIGPYAGPIEHSGFQLDIADGHLQIGAGRYYVDGILVENEKACSYAAQPDYPLPDDDALSDAFENSNDQVLWIYLDVWERHITAIEDDAISEKALRGPDTCTRAQVVWQVKALPAVEALENRKADLEQVTDPPRSAESQVEIDAEIEDIDNALESIGKDQFKDQCKKLLKVLTPVREPSMAARVDPGHQIDDPCVTPPDSKYRGPENQLYRVEIHRGGKAETATFKWSRDNGSVATAWLGTEGNDLLVASARGFAAGNWVELSDDTLELRGQAGVLVKLTTAEGGKLSVDPGAVSAGDDMVWTKDLRNPKVRRWDQIETDDISLVDGAVSVNEKTTGADVWVYLEDGVQVQFSAAAAEYRTGDYWLIPARVATGKIEWPAEEDEQFWQSPHGVEHHYAPLGFVEGPSDQIELKDSCRCTFAPGSDCPDSFVSVEKKAKPLGAIRSPKAKKPSPRKAPRPK